MHLGSVAARVRAGEKVTFRAVGQSMRPRVISGQLVTVVPMTDMPKKDDVVLAKVKGRWFLHLVAGTTDNGKRVLISNNRGRVNGWTDLRNVVGILEDDKAQKS